MKLAASVALVCSLCMSCSAKLTRQEGHEIATKMLSTMSNTLETGSMAAQADEMFAEELEWNWSGPQTGKGPKADLVKEMDAGWARTVSAFLTSSPFVVTDTKASKISVAFDLYVNADGRGKVPNCYVNVPCVWTFHVNGAKKVVRWDALWDNEDPQMLNCVGKVMAARAAEL